MVNTVTVNEFSPNMVCALILWRSGLGLLMGKFHRFLTDLSACHTIMAEYYHFTFLFLFLRGNTYCHRDR